MSTLYLAWRQPDQRWWPIGRLSYDGAEYVFAYTKGARAALAGGFRSLPSFPDLDETYYSKDLFPLFANRLPPRTRPDYDDFVEWLDLRSGEQDPIVMLARSGGQRETDMFEVFPPPLHDSGHNYKSAFFVHGLRHRGPEAEQAAGRLAPGDPLVLQPDPHNPHDPKALRVLTTVTGIHLGFVPRYLCDDVHALQAASGSEGVAVRVRRINAPPAPAQFRVLCEMSAPWPHGFQALAHPDFEPIPALMPAARP
jgi:hypothetical protein